MSILGFRSTPVYVGTVLTQYGVVPGATVEARLEDLATGLWLTDWATGTWGAYADAAHTLVENPDVSGSYGDFALLSEAPDTSFQFKCHLRQVGGNGAGELDVVLVDGLVRDAIWSAITAENNDPGTMGGVLGAIDVASLNTATVVETLNQGIQLILDRIDEQAAKPKGCA